ncbi:MAG: DUF927 domain-containing protein [Cupriavidus necator]
MALYDEPFVAAGDDEQAAFAAADAQATAPTFPPLAERPCWSVHDDWVLVGDRRFKPGVYYHTAKDGQSGPELSDKWVCSPLWVLAVTRNREDGDYGRLLEFISTAGQKKKWAMPMSMLAGDGNDARSVLLSNGVTFNLHDRGGILHYIACQTPKLTMRAATTTGWSDGAFVLPDAVIGADDIWFQQTGRTAPYGAAGTAEGWREDLAKLAAGNPLLMLAICAGLAGPLLEPLNVDGGGLHFFGDSSCGKTTALQAATSAWGGRAYRRTWRSTANGLEGAGAMHTDTLLALDELGEIDPKHLYEAAYALANGMGKTRANRHGESRQVARWRVFLVSTGEVTIAGRLASGGIEAKAGQSLRILDVPVSGAYGLFDDLRGFDSGARLSDAIRNAAERHYGHAGPAFVAALVKARHEALDLAEALDEVLAKFSTPDGQERRAARLFAVCALAGELASFYGVAPWPKGEPTAAAILAFKRWCGHRGTNGQNAEHVAILRAVADFLDKHADSRFSDIDAGGTGFVRDRAGYWRQDGDSRLYLFTAAGMREAVKGFDLRRALAALDAAGAIAARDTGASSKTTRTPDGRTPRLYHIAPGALVGGGDA